jgi:quercetin dioxygenase-like cupin family protein
MEVYIMEKVVRVSEVTPVEMVPGVYRRTMSYSGRLMITHFTLLEGAVVPPHHHPHDQISFVIEGEVEFTVDGQVQVLRTGESLLLPGNVEHGARAVRRTIVLDTFAPPREDYI